MPLLKSYTTASVEDPPTETVVTGTVPQRAIDVFPTIVPVVVPVDAVEDEADDSETPTTTINLDDYATTAALNQAIADLTALDTADTQVFSTIAALTALTARVAALEGVEDPVTGEIEVITDHVEDHVYLSTDLLTENMDVLTAENGDVLQWETEHGPLMPDNVLVSDTNHTEFLITEDDHYLEFTTAPLYTLLMDDGTTLLTEGNYELTLEYEGD